MKRKPFYKSLSLPEDRDAIIAQVKVYLLMGSEADMSFLLRRDKNIQWFSVPAGQAILIDGTRIQADESQQQPNFPCPTGYYNY